MTFLGLGLPEWLLIIGLVGGLWLTFKMMARASVAYERARQAREAKASEQQVTQDEEGQT
ncbi:MAG: hypothetical protein QOG54_1224 [Actinomycetota bacterium]|nr:hypothetical protein [Actinomycetota bacterium]